jgi:transcriptional regulator with XRE-family HTH domain
MIETGVADVARRRIRSVRLARGWTLDELARRTNIGASTISRIETGHRRLTVEDLADLARALQTTVDDLLVDDGDDVIIRPTPFDAGSGGVYWPLSRTRDTSGRVVSKLRFLPSTKPPEPKTHPGRDWFYVLDGVARLVLGDREHLVHPGEVAEFDTTTPHWIAGYGGPVELIMIFDGHGEHAHLGPAHSQGRAVSSGTRKGAPQSGSDARA